MRQVVIGHVGAVTAACLRASGTVGLGHASLTPRVTVAHHTKRIIQNGS